VGEGMAQWDDVRGAGWMVGCVVGEKKNSSFPVPTTCFGKEHNNTLTAGVDITLIHNRCRSA